MDRKVLEPNQAQDRAVGFYTHLGRSLQTCSWWIVLFPHFRMNDKHEKTASVDLIKNLNIPDV